MKLGIVGLPNVGKSTLFNAITKAGAQSANYPFCTIEPNVGVVAVPDKPGGLAEVLKKLSDAKIDIEYMYSLFAHKGEYAYMVIQTSNEEALNKALDGSDFKVIGMEELGLK